jgi:hypothetical protein
MNEKRKYAGKTIAEKLDIIAEVDKKERSKTEIAQAYGFHSPQSTYLKNLDSIENQALQGEVSKRMRICEAKHSDLEDNCSNGFAVLALRIFL